MAADSTSKLPLGTPTGPLRAQPKPRITDVPHRIESRRQCPGAPASATAPTHDAHYFQQPSGLHLRPARAAAPRPSCQHHETASAIETASSPSAGRERHRSVAHTWRGTRHRQDRAPRPHTSAGGRRSIRTA